MRLDEQVAETERETDALIGALKQKLQNYQFRSLGKGQFEDVGRVYERRGGPATQAFVKSKIRESRHQEQDYRKLLDVVWVVSQGKVDIYLKGFILRKLPAILPEHFSR